MIYGYIWCSHEVGIPSENFKCHFFSATLNHRNWFNEFRNSTNSKTKSGIQQFQKQNQEFNKFKNKIRNSTNSKTKSGIQQIQKQKQESNKFKNKIRNSFPLQKKSTPTSFEPLSAKKIQIFTLAYGNGCPRQQFIVWSFSNKVFMKIKSLKKKKLS